MYIINHMTRDRSNPSGKLNIYVSCPLTGPFEHFERIAEIVLQHGNYAVWYYEDIPEEEVTASSSYVDIYDAEKVFERLSHSRLLILVLSRYSTQSDTDRQLLELSAARHEKTAVLPVLVDDADIDSFPEEIRRLEFCLLNSGQEMAEDGRRKIEAFLSSVLVGGAQEEQIRKEFRWRAFLSYRKKDRESAMTLMRKIHDIPEFYDCGIWYDAYLTPGESYDNELSQEIRSCDVFLMNITPNMLEWNDGIPNYVVQYEYPEARQAERLVVPVEMHPTDDAALESQFPGIPPSLPASDAVLREKLQGLGSDGKNRNYTEHTQHCYYMGLAYLLGIDTEKRPKRAIDLLERAADRFCLPAYERLISCYRHGNGVEQSYNRMFEWADKYVKCLRQLVNDQMSKRYTREQMEELLGKNIDEPSSTLFIKAHQLGQDAMTFGRMADARYFFSVAQDAAGEMRHWINAAFGGVYPHGSNALSKLFFWTHMETMAYTALGDAYGTREEGGDYGRAMSFHNTSIRMLEDLMRDLEEEPSHLRLYRLQIVGDYKISCQHAGDTANVFGDYALAGHFWKKAADAESYSSASTFRGRINRIINRSKDADVKRNESRFLEALSIYQECVTMSDELYEETGELEALRVRAVLKDRIVDVCTGISYENIQSSYEDRRHILEMTRTGDSLEAKRDLSLSLERGGNLMMAQGSYIAALEYYEACEALRSEILRDNVSPQLVGERDLIRDKLRLLKYFLDT